MVVIRIFLGVKLSISDISQVLTERSIGVDALQLLISFGCPPLLGIPFAINLISQLPLFLFSGIAFSIVVIIVGYLLTTFRSQSIDRH